ncbi:hypothetical protein TUM19329_15870 [Legionella antarctica]|uniref:Uncharacterized protein n=1 Tax=Legionella antarctica TaxID=2708020 RepID=A0A6F8T5I6_9GAMM|nr:hypothetical protein [Legionella antarctica]BCA95226.1 hypothetical protein TUM19329_15870 [Legionella antarctica]
MILSNSIENLTFLVILILILILFGSIFVAFKFNPAQYHKTRISVFLSTIASVAMFLVAINIILTSLSFEHNTEYTRLVQTKAAIDKLWLYPNQVITSSKKIRPQFLAGFYPANFKLYKQAEAESTKSQQSIESIAEEQYISTLLIQTWEDFLNQRKFGSTETNTWITSFLPWAQNPYFREYFEIFKFEYNKSTIELANLLFEYAASIPVPTRDTTIYQETADKILKDPRFHRIVNL